MANFSQMSNSFAQQYLATQNVESNTIYTNIKGTLGADIGADFIPDRMTAFVGTNPDNPNSSYVIVIEPAFLTWTHNQPNHQTASMVSYFAEGKDSYCGTEVLVNHNPFEIQNLTLIECDTDGNKIVTSLDRANFEGMDTESIALQMSQMSTANLDPDKFEVINTFPTPTDLAAMVNITLGTAAHDGYSAPLYPAGALNRLLNDSSIPAMFSQAAAMKTAANNQTGSSSITFTACGCCSCNGCSSTSCSIKVTISISWGW